MGENVRIFFFFNLIFIFDILAKGEEEKDFFLL